jgi:uncharacterized protein
MPAYLVSDVLTKPSKSTDCARQTSIRQHSGGCLVRGESIDPLGRRLGHRLTTVPPFAPALTLYHWRGFTDGERFGKYMRGEFNQIPHPPLILMMLVLRKRGITEFRSDFSGGPSMSEIIILPGIGGSGDAHWQTHWEDAHQNMRRFAPASWDQPDLRDWIAALDSAVAAASEPPLLVAHSLACLLISLWRRVSHRPIIGAFLVAVPDPNSPQFPDEAAEFVDIPEEPLGFPSLIVASSNDPFASLAYVRRRAAGWGTGLVEVGALGHINGASCLGAWKEGLNLLTAFMAGCDASVQHAKRFK